MRWREQQPCPPMLSDQILENLHIESLSINSYTCFCELVSLDGACEGNFKQPWSELISYQGFAAPTPLDCLLLGRLTVTLH